MASDILINPQSTAQFTITLASLANGSARQSTLITNSGKYPAALVFLQIKSGASIPTLGATYNVYLIRKDGNGIADDGAGSSDAAITITNANFLGAIAVTANAATNFFGVFDTSSLGPLGPTWGIAVYNLSGQALDTTEANHVKDYIYYNPQAQ